MNTEMLPMQTFLTTFSKWLDALEKGESQDAGFFVDQLHAVGMMLAVNPDFVRLYSVYQRPGALPSAEEALDCFHAFLHAITDAACRGRYRNRH